MPSKEHYGSSARHTLYRSGPALMLSGGILLSAIAMIGLTVVHARANVTATLSEGFSNPQAAQPQSGGLIAGNPGGSTSVHVRVSTPLPNGGHAGGDSQCDCCKDCEGKLNETRKDLEARIEADRKDAEGRIDKWMDTSKWILALVIGLAGIVYPVFGGFAAYVNIKAVRDDAKDMLAEVRKRMEEIEQKYSDGLAAAREAARNEAQNQAELYRKGIDELERKHQQVLKDASDEAKRQLEAVRKDSEEFVQQYQQNFPEFTAMEERLLRLMREMERRMPSEEDWNNDDSFRKLSEADRQYILDSELPVAAMSVFNFDKSSKLKPRLSSIYAVFARFYLGRYGTLTGDSESDFWRAVSYAGRAIDLDPEGSAGYRLRGAIHLARYERLSKASPPASADVLEKSLTAAELDLSQAIQKGTAESVDAGAYYNQALVRYYRGDIEGAIRVSRQLLGLESKVSRLHREKYLPGIYVNLGSFLAMLAERAAKENQPEAVRQFGSQAVEAIVLGAEDLKKTEVQDEGLARLKGLLRSELDSDQELSRLGQTYRAQLDALLRGGATGGVQSNPEEHA